MKLEDYLIKALREEGFYNNYNDLFIPDRVEKEQVEKFEKNLQRLGLGHLFNKESVLVFGKSNKDIKIGESFNVLFSHNSIENYIKVKAILKYVNLSPGRKIDYLPRGYTGICLLEFIGGVPELIDKLKFYKEKRDKHKHDTLYLTQEPVINRILELLNEFEKNNKNQS